MEKEKHPLFIRGINSLEQRMESMRKIVKLARLSWEQKNITGAYDAAFDLVDEMEKAALLARALPAHTGHPQAMKQLNARFAEQTPMRMGFTPEGWFCLIIPSLLPKKKNNGAAYLRDMIYPGIAGFFRGKPPVRYTDCALIFRHVYDRSRPERAYRDHDNVEVSTVINIIAHFLLVDDSALRCSQHQFSSPGDEECTEVFVVPQREFIDWHIAAKNYPDKGVILLENLPR